MNKDNFNELTNEIITLCGSTKFKESFERLNIVLSLQRNVVLSVICFSHFDKRDTTEEEKMIFDEMHLRKIDMSNSIFVIDIDLSSPPLWKQTPYVGESTKQEIEYAISKGKVVRYLSQLLGIESK